MPDSCLLRAARSVLLAMLCMGVALLALPVGAGSIWNGAHDGADASMLQHGHHGNSADEGMDSEPGHAQQHDGGHSHDTPHGAVNVDYDQTAPGMAPPAIYELPVPSLTPLPDDRPPEVLTQR